MSEAEFCGFGDFFLCLFFYIFRTQVQLLTAEVTIIIVHLNQFFLPAKRKRKQRPAHNTCMLISFGRKFGHTRKETNTVLQKFPNLKIRRAGLKSTEQAT